jgi:hypothetical protein
LWKYVLDNDVLLEQDVGDLILHRMEKTLSKKQPLWWCKTLFDALQMGSLNPTDAQRIQNKKLLMSAVSEMGAFHPPMALSAMLELLSHPQLDLTPQGRIVFQIQLLRVCDQANDELAVGMVLGHMACWTVLNLHPSNTNQHTDPFVEQLSEKEIQIYQYVVEQLINMASPELHHVQVMPAFADHPHGYSIAWAQACQTYLSWQSFCTLEKKANAQQLHAAQTFFFQHPLILQSDFEEIKQAKTRIRLFIHSLIPLTTAQRSSWNEAYQALGEVKDKDPGYYQGLFDLRSSVVDNLLRGAIHTCSAKEIAQVLQYLEQVTVRFQEDDLLNYCQRLLTAFSDEVGLKKAEMFWSQAHTLSTLPQLKKSSVFYAWIIDLMEKNQSNLEQLKSIEKLIKKFYKEFIIHPSAVEHLSALQKEIKRLSRKP